MLEQPASQLQNLTGRSLSDPRGMAELATAAYALRFSFDSGSGRKRGVRA